ncbi:hypothetical protein E4U51_002365 [Claviceps purpurea]|nr:hypothetical protein E4U51_002365 [Claviceps purpurea]
MKTTTTDADSTAPTHDVASFRRCSPPDDLQIVAYRNITRTPPLQMADDFLCAADTTPNAFQVFHDAGFVSQSVVPSLPRGDCNFVYLTNGTRCGCRRFWPRQNLGGSLVDQTGWCMCAHHACYHDQGPQDGLQKQYTDQQTWGAFSGQDAERGRDEHKHLSPLADMPMGFVEATSPAMDFTAFSSGIPLSFVHELPGLAEETGKAHTHSPHPESMPDTLPWDGRNQAPFAGVGRQFGPSKAGDMSPVPPQQLMASQAASSTSSAGNRISRPFGGKGPATLSRTNSAPDVTISQKPLQEGTIPPRLSFQDDRQRDGSFVFVGPDENDVDAPRPETATQLEPRAVAAHSEQHTRPTLGSLYDTVSGHETRLDQLETVSFSAHGYEECLDKHDHMDLRVTDLESRMDGVEKTMAQGDHNSDAKDDDGATSVASTVAGSASRLNPEDILNQISNLQARVNHMQSFLPSPSFSWIVEVVFLPFPLNRLWQNMAQFKSDHAVSSDDWTQMPMTSGSANMRSQSPFGGGDWTARNRNFEWLHPRACGDKSTQDRRLRSRGLIQTVSFSDPDAKSVQTAIHKVFGAEFRTMGITPRRETSNRLVTKYLALQETWVPLRKVHKDSRLRFLSAAELLTPASWDVNFLHSVTMKAVQPRLFITHPDAYIQDYGAYEAGWTWQRIRDMEEVCADVTESQEAREADAVEHCWHWNEQLDGAPKTLTVTNIRQSCERGSTSPAPKRQLRSRSCSIARDPYQTQTMSSRRTPRPPRIRTTPSPSVSAMRPVLATAGHRGIVSRGQSRQSSPFARGLSQPGVQKRLRSTRSPSHHRYTPRWTISPSPVPQGFSKRHVSRGMTPLAYATPHSNAPLQELRPIRSGSAVRKHADQHHYLGAAYATDELFDIEIYESGSEMSYSEDGHAADEEEDDDDDDDDDDEQSAPARAVGLPHLLDKRRHGHDSHDRQLPEDEPWPGIEDWPQPGTCAGDAKVSRPASPEDHHSDASSQPSEYPTTEGAWPMVYDGEAGFSIHED